MNAPRRNILAVLEEILKVVPPTEEPLRSALNEVLKDLSLVAPEVVSTEHWGDVADILQEYVGPPREEWQVRVKQIFNDERATEIVS